MVHNKLPAFVLPVVGCIVGGTIGNALAKPIFGSFTESAFIFVAVCPLVGFVVGAILAWRMMRPTSKYPKGHCRRCGYNLHGNVSGVCPECGMNL